jgi:hypothetical protein
VPPNPVAYSDVRQFLEMVMQHGEARVRIGSQEKAWQFLQRLNRFRVADRKDHNGVSIWDNWVFKRPIDGTVEVCIRPRMEPGTIQIETLDGRSLDEEYAKYYQKPDPLGNVGQMKPDLAWEKAVEDYAKSIGIKPEDQTANEIRERDKELARKPLKLDE